MGIKKLKNKNGHIILELKLIIAASIIFVSHSTINADNYSLASFVDNSKTFDLPIKLDSTGFTSFSSVIYDDVNKKSIQDAGEYGTSGVIIKLFDKDGSEINVGPDGILGTVDDSPGGVITNSKGEYSFSKITHDYYRIQIESESESESKSKSKSKSESE